MSQPDLKEQFIESIPKLRSFALSLSGNPDLADDLVQDTLAKAIANRDKFKDGTNLIAWLMTILRNQFYDFCRKNKREVADPEGVHASKLSDAPRQDGNLEVKDFLKALQLVPLAQREALILVGANGFSYEEAAEVLGVQIGTVKSRVSRARTRMEELIDGADAGSGDLDMAGTSKRSSDAPSRKQAPRKPAADEPVAGPTR